MIIKTNEGLKIKCTDHPVPSEKASNGGNPVWSEYHNRFYVFGFRWIKSKGKFSGICGLHNFKSFTRCE